MLVVYWQSQDIMVFNKSVTVEVCLKSTPALCDSNLDPSTANLDQQLLQSILTNALTMYIDNHHNKVVPDSYLQLKDIAHFHGLPSTMLRKLLKSSAESDGDSGSSGQMNLSRAELLVALHVQRVYIGSISDVGPDEEVSLGEIWESLNELRWVGGVPGSQPDQIDTSTTQFHFIFYQNIDSVADSRVYGRVTTASSPFMDDFDNITLSAITSNSSASSKNEKVYQLNKLFHDAQDLNYINESIKHHSIPSTKFDSLWDDLKIDPSLKIQILSQISNSLLSPASSNDLQGNLFIFHGPPGSGKSTLCKAIAQKLSINHQFSSVSDSSTLLLEISCEKIFSKWYGESSQNLIKLFQIMAKIIEYYSNALIVLIVDEIETLANSRAQILTKNETSDGVRIVNTLLTQLDFLKKYSNFVIFATSNLLDSIDEAFLDRSDGCFFIDRPNALAQSEILKNSIRQLVGKGLLQNDEKFDQANGMYQEVLHKLGMVCEQELGLSGRGVKKLPQIAISRLVQGTQHSTTKRIIHIDHFLKSLANVVLERVKDIK